MTFTPPNRPLQPTGGDAARCNSDDKRSRSRFKSAVTEALQPLSPSLTQVLRQLIEYDYPKQVASIDFEIFADVFTR